MADERIRQSVKITDPLTDANEAGVDANGELQVVIPTSITPGAGATFLGKAEDVASAAGDVGVAIMAVQDATLTALGSADGDYTHLRVDANGALHITGAAAGVSHIDNAAFTEDADDGVPAFGLFHDVTPPLVTEGNAGIVRISANRNAYQTIRDSAGNERGANVTAANELNVIATAQPGVDIGDVDVLSVIPGVGATELGKAIDDAVGGTDTGVAALVQRVDTPAGLTPADGDYVTLQVDANGRLHVTDPNAGAGSPSTPVVDRPALANVAAGASSTGTELRTADLGGTTVQLAGLDVTGSAPFKWELISEIDDAETIEVTGFGRAGEMVQWRPPNKGYFNVVWAANAGFDGWRVEVTNLDTSQTTDFYTTFYRED